MKENNQILEEKYFLFIGFEITLTIEKAIRRCCQFIAPSSSIQYWTFVRSSQGILCELIDQNFIEESLESSHISHCNRFYTVVNWVRCHSEFCRCFFFFFFSHCSLSSTYVYVCVSVWLLVLAYTLMRWEKLFSSSSSFSFLLDLFFYSFLLLF